MMFVIAQQRDQWPAPRGVPRGTVRTRSGSSAARPSPPSGLVVLGPAGWLVLLLGEGLGSSCVVPADGAELTLAGVADAMCVADHEAAVRATVEWIEDTSVLVRQGRGGHVRLPGDGLIAAAYRHRMSRALDPQLHTHVVAANLTRGPDGRFTALFGTPLYRAAKTAGYLYQAHLRAEISDRLGLEWGPVRKGAAELNGIPTEALEEFSRRRHEMQRAAAEGGFSLDSKRSAEAAAVDTRERKQYGIETHTWRD